MMWAVAVKESIQAVYRAYDVWLVPLFRAALAFSVFLMLNAAYGFDGRMGGMPVVLLCSLLTAFLPWSSITFFAAVMVLGNLYEKGIPLMAVAALSFLAIALVQTTFRARYAFLIALMPFCFLLHLQFLLPVVAGLSFGFTAFVPIALGTCSYYFLNYLAETADGLSEGGEIMEMLNQYAGILKGFFENRTMFLVMLAMAMITVIVYIVRNLSFNYAWHLAVVSGLLSGALLLILGGSLSGMEVDVFETLISMSIALVIAFFYVLIFYAADYQGTKRLQFEDDDYYYFVKAVPKLKQDAEAELDEEDEE